MKITDPIRLLGTKDAHIIIHAGLSISPDWYASITSAEACNVVDFERTNDDAPTFAYLYEGRGPVRDGSLPAYTPINSRT